MPLFRALSYSLYVCLSHGSQQIHSHNKQILLISQITPQVLVLGGRYSGTGISHNLLLWLGGHNLFLAEEVQISLATREIF